ncbi:DUF1996 domain-containing protein [Nonomuraea gerenzanensis]|uniref:Putative secreted protein n=1 Tax=Nonomuraea gerenzanensis TaxID=93944 RepID=A0A1M4E9T7_9ACTN|nr:DUF1996 domain-containing protein [Nonomuraea gerenzanensis]UBU17789.1 DUF1996 domain-containing protein [Nonomuraea gerenzanensis]SBO95570.1 putative secreted protein [Nonomuraea gerenzanensis]
MHPSSRPGRPPLWPVVTALVAVLAACVAAVSPAFAADGLISEGRPATASSVESSGHGAGAAFDGTRTTRWSSAAADPQWLQVDLGAPATISRVVLEWEAAYGRSFRIQTSADAATWTDVYTTGTGTGGTQSLDVRGTGRYVRLYGTARGTGYGYSLWEFQIYGTGGATTTPRPRPTFTDEVTHHEFQANCSVTAHRPDDPIVYPGLPGASHLHTFIGNRTTNAHSTTASLLAGATSCTNPHDRSAYWFPSFHKGDRLVEPIGNQVVYYKSGILEYWRVQPFPQGLRFVAGSPGATLEQFRDSPGAVEGFECGDLSRSWDLPASCVAGSQVNVRYQAPSCWDGVRLDSADHRSHMAYPSGGYCPASHPVAVPMLEFKIAFPADGDLSQARLSSGRGYSWHYDFFNAWDDPAVLDALVTHCINGGLQCDPRGYDLYKPHRGAALTPDFQLPRP